MGRRPIAIAAGAGTVAGALGLRPQKVALGPVVGAAVGRPSPASTPTRPRPPIASATVLAYRVASAAIFRDAQVSTAGRARRRPGSCRSSCRSKRAPGTSAPSTSVRWPTYWAAPTSGPSPTSASSRRSTCWPAPSSIRTRAIRGAGVLRAHDALQARHRARVAAVGAARLPALPHRRGPPAGAGKRPDEPTRRAARCAQPHRHHRRGRRRSARHPRVDPVVRRHRRADLHRDLHDVPRQRTRLRQRRVPAAPDELHRDARSPRPPGRRAHAHQPELASAPGPLLHLRGPRDTGADDGSKSKASPRSSTSTSRTAKSAPSTRSGCSASRSSCSTTASTARSEAAAAR